jgi:hypothetical protein
MNKTLVTSSQITDDLVKRLNAQNESQAPDTTVLEGEVIADSLIQFSASDQPASAAKVSRDDERTLQTRISEGEWDNLDDLPAFRARTPEGQLMLRINAIDNRVRQLETRLPMLLNQHLHDAYIQVLKKIHALRQTKGALFYLFYKDEGQRDLNSGES